MTPIECLQKCEEWFFKKEPTAVLPSMKDTAFKTIRDTIAKSDGTKWAPTTESLTEIDQEVLVFWKTQRFNYIETAYISAITEYKRGKELVRAATWMTKNYDLVDPTHWMPLPVPPMSAEKEEK